MTDEHKISNEQNNNQQIRQDMVTTAVYFLMNPNVIDKPYEHKAAFLKKKGLTDAEISLAYGKAESDPKYKQILENVKNNKVNSVPSTSPVLPPPVPVYKPLSFWTQLSRFSSSFIVLGVAVFGAHYVYKTYIEPLIYGEDKENKSGSLDEQLLDMKNSLCELEKHVASLEESMSFQKEQMDKFIRNEVSEYYPTPLALRDLKTEIASVKSLLLNRHQFPALPKVSPTIPQWQLPSSEDDNDPLQQNGETSGCEPLDKDCSLKLDNELGLSDNELGLSENDDTQQGNNGTNDIITPEIESLQNEYSEELGSELQTC